MNFQMGLGLAIFTIHLEMSPVGLRFGQGRSVAVAPLPANRSVGLSGELRGAGCRKDPVQTGEREVRVGPLSPEI
jgi:hypothetical protein